MFIYFGCTGYWLLCGSFLFASSGGYSLVVVHRLSCPVAGGILWGQGLDPRPLHQQVDSQPLDLCGSEKMLILMAEMGTDLVAGTAQV